MKYLIISSLALLPAALGAQLVVENWQLNDPDGTALENAANGGAWNSSWNTLTGATMNGAGSLVLAGDSSNGTAISYDTAITGTGKYLWEVTFSGWNFADSPRTGEDYKLALNAVDSTGDFLARVYFILNANDTNPLLRAGSSLSGGDTFTRTVNTDTLNLVESSLSATVGIEFDFDADSVTYFYNGTQTHSSTGLVPTDIGGLSIGRFGAGGWTDASNSLSIDSITLTAVPEPGTYALYMGLVVLGAIQYRRRRRLQ